MRSVETLAAIPMASGPSARRPQDGRIERVVSQGAETRPRIPAAVERGGQSRHARQPSVRDQARGSRAIGLLPPKAPVPQAASHHCRRRPGARGCGLPAARPCRVSRRLASGTAAPSTGARRGPTRATGQPSSTTMWSATEMQSRHSVPRDGPCSGSGSMRLRASPPTRCNGRLPSARRQLMPA